MYVSAVTFSHAYVDVVAVIEIYGWLLTIEYVKCFLDIHAFAVMLKIIVVKDILRIVIIYVFILIGFSFALHAYIIAEFSLSECRTTFADTAYQMSLTALSLGDFVSDSTESSSILFSNPSAVKILFVMYICLCTMMLMNILIAMMTNTYYDVLELKKTLWCVERLRFVAWISQDNILGIRTACRRLTTWWILDHCLPDEERIRLGIPTDITLLIDQKTDSGKELKNDNSELKDMVSKMTQRNDATQIRIRHSDHAHINYAQRCQQADF